MPDAPKTTVNAPKPVADILARTARMRRFTGKRSFLCHTCLTSNPQDFAPNTDPTTTLKCFYCTLEAHYERLKALTEDE